MENISKTMLELTYDYLKEIGIFDENYSKIINKIIEVIPYSTVPYEMKAIIAISELITYASQFRRNIRLWDNASVPINTISFVLTQSGANKDSSVAAARSCFKQGYKQLNKYRHDINIKLAQHKANLAGETMYDNIKIFSSYLNPEPPLFISSSSAAGFIQHINDLAEHQLGSGLLYSGEFGDELAYNQDMTECIKVLAETYDLGNKEIKYTKLKELRSKEITGQAVSALLIGSPTYILYDENVKKKFNIAFMSKLARRSWFWFIPSMLKEKTYLSLEEMIKEEEAIETISNNARQDMILHIEEVTKRNLPMLGEEITVSNKVTKLFKIYKRYNSELAENMINENSVEKLVRKHLQWKALKFAGALALFNNQDEIIEQNYIDAIKFTELLSEGMKVFEHELNKAPYEKFADYLHILANNEKNKEITISAHDIKKMGFIKTITKEILQNLATSAASYDKDGVYQVNKDNINITYTQIIRTNNLEISFKEIDLSKISKAYEDKKDKEYIAKLKSNVAKNAYNNFTVAQTTFKELAKLLADDFAYSPFKFKDGIRDRRHIQEGTKWLVLDIDKSEITAEEAHFMFQDINHHIALTSDPNNNLKFRILVELDSIVKLDNITWSFFYKLIGEYLGLNIDPLPQSQIFYSYKNRKVLSIINQTPLEVKTFVMEAHDIVRNKIDINKDKKLSSTKKKALIEDEFNTFEFAFDAEFGEGSRQLIRAARKAYFSLDMNKEDTLSLVKRINNYWTVPMEQQRFTNTILNQIHRW